jgi:hypothetical protein
MFLRASTKKLDVRAVVWVTQPVGTVVGLRSIHLYRQCTCAVCSLARLTHLHG